MSSATRRGGYRSARSRGRSGHSLGAASAIEAAVSVRALRDQLIPPTINYLPDPELDLDYVPNQARAARLDHVLTASFGFGGTNNALILRRIYSMTPTITEPSPDRRSGRRHPQGREDPTAACRSPRIPGWSRTWRSTRSTWSA